MASFTAGTTFSDGVANDVTAAKLGALVTNATPTSGFIQDRTSETVIASNDTVLIGDASDSNNLKRITVDNLMKADMTGNINSTSGTIATVTLGTSIGTAATFTSGTLTTGVIPNLTIGTTTGTAANFTNGTITTGLIPTLTAGTTTSTAATITTGTIPTLVSTTLITSGTGTAAAPAIVPTGDTNNGLFFPAADNIAVSTNGTERVRVDSSGNVGIGTTSPNGNLAISSSTATIVTNSTGSTISQYSNLALYANSGSYSLQEVIYGSGLAQTAITTSTNSGYQIGTTSSSWMAFISNNNERMRIDPTGNCSIGTASALSKLHVHGDLTLSNTTTSTTGATGGVSKPATYAGFLTVSINGTSRKIPYYA